MRNIEILAFNTQGVNTSLVLIEKIERRYGVNLRVQMLTLGEPAYFKKLLDNLDIEYDIHFIRKERSIIDQVIEKLVSIMLENHTEAIATTFNLEDFSTLVLYTLIYAKLEYIPILSEAHVVHPVSMIPREELDLYARICNIPQEKRVILDENIEPILNEIAVRTPTIYYSLNNTYYKLAKLLR